jgi:hypothetical protein
MVAGAAAAAASAGKPAPDDPSAGIMDMMKKMYEEGDADMKVRPAVTVNVNVT